MRKLSLYFSSNETKGNLTEFSIIFILYSIHLTGTGFDSIKIKSWSGKKNWPKKADQAKNGEWPDLDKKWFDFY